jgi:phytoene desaturase
MSKVVIIGSGVGGMSAAARLARRGHQVTILEQSGTPGGKLAGYARDGFVFDTGPSLLTLPAVYRDLFAKTGRRLETALDLELLDPGFAYRWPDGTRAELPGIDSTRAAAALGQALGGRAEEQWNAFMSRAADAWRITRGPFLESPLGGPLDLIKHLRRPSDVTTVAPFTSLRKLGQRSFDDPRLVTLLDRYATYTGSDPRRAPAALSVVPYVEQTFGAWHISGGLHQLAFALRDRCDRLGVAFRFDTAVSRIVVEATRAAGVITADGERIDADVVVANADASHVYGRMLRDPRGKSPLRKLQRTTPSLAGFVLLLAVKGRTPGLRHNNVLFPADYDAEFDAIFGRGGPPRPVDDPTIYICAPDDPRMRPDDDHESWFVLVNAPRHDPVHGVDWNDKQLVATYSQRILDVMAERGLDVRDRLLWHEARTPAMFERMVRAPGGSIYGSSSNGPSAAFLRPANRSPVPGLFLVGGSSHPGGGLPLVTLSAAIVSDLIGDA